MFAEVKNQRTKGNISLFRAITKHIYKFPVNKKFYITLKSACLKFSLLKF